MAKVGGITPERKPVCPISFIQSHKPPPSPLEFTRFNLDLVSFEGALYDLENEYPAFTLLNG